MLDDRVMREWRAVWGIGETRGRDSCLATTSFQTLALLLKFSQAFLVLARLELLEKVDMLAGVLIARGLVLSLHWCLRRLTEIFSQIDKNTVNLPVSLVPWGRIRRWELW